VLSVPLCFRESCIHVGDAGVETRRHRGHREVGSVVGIDGYEEHSRYLAVKDRIMELGRSRRNSASIGAIASYEGARSISGPGATEEEAKDRIREILNPRGVRPQLKQLLTAF
jgi:hypothetical protein